MNKEDIADRICGIAYRMVGGNPRPEYQRNHGIVLRMFCADTKKPIYLIGLSV